MAVFGVVLDFKFNLSAEPKSGDTIVVQDFADNSASDNSNVLLVARKDTDGIIRFSSCSMLQWVADIWEKVGDNTYHLAISEPEGRSDKNGIYKATYIPGPDF